ncbi:MAG: DNA circularization N-terminal domain-containing protein [Pseudomonadota bacterium]
MTDWSKRFRRASVAGVRFWVLSESPVKERRVAVHEISGGEQAVTEDMGRGNGEIVVQAYVAGDAADTEGNALEAVFDIPSPVPLTLPMDPAQIVHAQTCARNRKRDRNGFIAYDLTFLPASNGAAVEASAQTAMRDVWAAGSVVVATAIGGLL